jgi:hypothetical protein
MKIAKSFMEIERAVRVNILIETSLGQALSVGWAAYVLIQSLKPSQLEVLRAVVYLVYGVVVAQATGLCESF